MDLTAIWAREALVWKDWAGVQVSAGEEGRGEVGLARVTVQEIVRFN